MFDKILVANRGEIAVRIIRACREMGIKTVAVYSVADRDSLHTKLADDRICIGEAAGKNSYLNMKAIISAAIVTKAKAIHPGVGFLAENSDFAKMCEEYGIKFIGPHSDTIKGMGNKFNAKNIAKKAAIPVITGSDKMFDDAQSAKTAALQIGYPVIIKASLGGGGRGMRIVRKPSEFEELFGIAQLEALNSCADGNMYIEKYIEKPRHVEVQILADAFGNVIYLGERECSIQRKHQKLIEETPCIAIDGPLRSRLGKAAVKLAKTVGYENAGTVEFLLDEDNNFYFMEMNTRLQVEHGITELVTGVDIVKEQIRIAMGMALTYNQKEIHLEGYAMECRINAENPLKDFMPCTGIVTGLHIPGGNGVRMDTAVDNGYVVSHYYDSMLIKCMTYDTDRALAVKKMQRVLDELVIEGVTTNLDYLKSVIHSKDFLSGNIDTHFLLEHYL